MKKLHHPRALFVNDGDQLENIGRKYLLGCLSADLWNAYLAV